jgi:septal ring factor EnvC (AmiA/AmiB activator)
MLPGVSPHMDIAGTKKKVQRTVKVAEETYKKINEVIERVEKLQRDLETTSEQVDYVERELAEQRALIEALAEQQGLDVETILEDVQYPERLLEEADNEDPGPEKRTPEEMATSRPSAADAPETDTVDGE